MEQAIFTSSRTQRMEGYQLVAASDGINAQQREELCAWGPAHDSLLWPQSRIGSINFHQLECGLYCISKTVPAGGEYSGRSGPRIYTTCLLLSGEQLRRFANQPFRVVDAAVAAGYMRVVRRFAESLPTVNLRGRASPALAALLEPLSDAQQRQSVLALATALCRGNVAVNADENLRLAYDQVFNLLPIGCRASVSFSTGLKPSPQRPLRIQPTLDATPAGAMPARSDAAERIDLAAPPEDMLSGWWARVDELLERGQITDLIALLSEQAESTSLGDLGSLSAAVTA